MPVAGNAAYEPSQDADPEQSLAVTVEAVFLARGSTLTDPVAAEAYGAALEVVMMMLSGARAQGILDEEAYEGLAGMIAGMRSAPERL